MAINFRDRQLADQFDPNLAEQPGERTATVTLRRSADLARDQDSE